MESAGVQQRTFTWRTNHQIMSNILGDILDHTDDAAGYLYNGGDEGRWAECEPLPLQEMSRAHAMRVRPALTPIGDGSIDIGDVQPHEMARCKAWAKSISHDVRTQLRTWLGSEGKGFSPLHLHW